MNTTQQKPITPETEQFAPLKPTPKRKRSTKTSNLMLSALVVAAMAFIFGLIGGLVGHIITKNNQGLSDALTVTDTISVNNTKEESAIITVAKESKPAVVSIIVSKDLPKIKDIPFTPFGFPQFNEKEKQTVGGGTGFIVESNGLIVTNKHVVLDENAEYTVLTNSKEEYTAEVLARDQVNDIAILKIEAENLPTLSFGNS